MPSKSHRDVTWEQFIELLIQHGVKIKKNWTIKSSPSGKEYTFHLLQNIVIPRKYQVPVQYYPQDRISDYSMRSICEQLHLDIDDIEFDLL